MNGVTIMPERDDDGNPIVRTSGVRSERKKRIRFVGTHSFTVLAGESEQQDWKIPQLIHKGTNVPSIFLGVRFCAEGGGLTDQLNFQVVDVDNILGYGAGVVLDEFGKDFYVFPGNPHTIREFAAQLPVGLYIRVVYKNNSVQSAQFVCNILRLIDTSGVA